jgi:hypothetical protein
VTDTTVSRAEECVDEVISTFGSVFASIHEWRAEIEALVAESDGQVTVERIDSVTEALVLPRLSEPGALVIGAGFVAVPHFLKDAGWHLAWWLGHSNTFGVGSADPSIRRLEAEEDPSTESFRDYTNLEWWRVPAQSMSPHITGPYVDYLCTDDYTLTLTVPVEHEGSLVGMVGADLYVNEIEKALLPWVRRIERTATIINASGRVVVSTDPHRATGSIVRAPSEGERFDCGDTGLRLVLDAA